MSGARWIFTGIVIALLITAGAVWMTGRTASSITVINTAPYNIAVAIAHPLNKKQWQTIGWFRLSAGETRTYESTFWWVKPSYYVVARQQDFAVVRHLHGESQWGWLGDDLVRYVNDDRMKFETDAQGNGLFPPDVFAVGFSRAAGDPKGKRFAATFSDPMVPRLTPGKEDALPLPEALPEAKRLAASLQRRLTFLAEWEGRPFPFHLGIVTDDPNSFLRPGIVITQAADRTRDNYPMRLFVGDRLLQFGGNDVYSEIDVLTALYEHATDMKRGVKVPIAFVAQRGSLLASDTTNYFFNRDYYPRSDSDALRAVGAGLWNSIFLGAGCEGKTFVITSAAVVANVAKWAAAQLDDSDEEPDYIKPTPPDQLQWACDQNEARIRQFEPDAFAAGTIVGMFVPSSRMALRTVGGKSARAVVNSAGGTIALEVAESMVWTTLDTSPMRTTEELTEELEDVLPLAAASGLLQGSLRFGKR